MPKPALVPLHLNPVLWKALGTCASKDLTRQNLTFVYATDGRTFSATDGHCGVEVVFTTDTELRPGFYDPKVTVARLKAGLTPEPLDPNGMQFPNLPAVFPKRTEGYAERSDVAINPDLLAKVANVFSDLLDEKPHVFLDASEDLAPLLMVAKNEILSIRAAVMPMSLDKPRRRPEKDTFELESAQEDVKQARADEAKARKEALALREELRAVQEAADTDAADAALARKVIEDLKAELNTLRSGMRPKAAVSIEVSPEPEPVLLTRRIDVGASMHA